MSGEGLEELPEDVRSFRDGPEFVIGVPHSAGDTFDERQKRLVEREGDFNGVGTVVCEYEDSHGGSIP